MDNICHTLAGAALAGAGLRRRTRYGTAVLLLGANLPDVDVAAYAWGGLAALEFRRGWTHGVLAVAVLPVLLAGLALLWHRVAGHRPSARPVRPGQLLLLAFLAVASHPLLDLLNTYGVRLLMPFSGRWFYGDTLFIIDPWLWLLLAAGAWLARGGREPGPARGALGLAAGYVFMMAGTAWWTHGVARAAAVEAGMEVRRVLAAPVPGTPFRRDVLVDEGWNYRTGRLVLGWTPRVDFDPVPWDRHASLSASRAAAATPEGKKFLGWSRYPYYQVHGTIVDIGDARYTRSASGSWASVRIALPDDD